MYLTQRPGLALTLKLHDKWSITQPWASIDFIRKQPYRHNENRWVEAFELSPNRQKAISDAAKATGQRL